MDFITDLASTSDSASIEPKNEISVKCLKIFQHKNAPAFALPENEIQGLTIKQHEKTSGASPDLTIK
jgi:hypothetical protein